MSADPTDCREVVSEFLQGEMSRGELSARLITLGIRPAKAAAVMHLADEIVFHIDPPTPQAQGGVLLGVY